MIEIAAGDALAPDQHGLSAEHVNGGLREVRVRQRAGGQEKRQREGAIDLSGKYMEAAQRMIEKLASRASSRCASRSVRT